MELFDTHCHIDDASFDHDRPQGLQQCRKSGIGHIAVPALVRSGWDALLTLCKSEPGLHPTLGLHPVYTNQHQDSDLTRLQEYVANKSVIAIGEIGLDYYIDNNDKARQQELFEAQLSIAKEVDLPVILHVRSLFLFYILFNNRGALCVYAFLITAKH